MDEIRPPIMNEIKPLSMYIQAKMAGHNGKRFANEAMVAIDKAVYEEVITKEEAKDLAKFFIE